MSSFIKEFINPRTGKKQVAYCIDDFYGRHQYGYGFLKNGKDAQIGETINTEECDFYKENLIKQ